MVHLLALQMWQPVEPEVQVGKLKLDRSNAIGVDERRQQILGPPLHAAALELRAAGSRTEADLPEGGGQPETPQGDFRLFRRAPRGRNGGCRPGSSLSQGTPVSPPDFPGARAGFGPHGGGPGPGACLEARR